MTVLKGNKVLMGNNSRHPLLFRYPGGKHYAMDLLRPFWNALPHTEYREPFVGGGSVFFNKDKVASTWLNDIDEELITTYKVIADPVLRKKLNDLVSKEIASKERWKEIYAFEPKNNLEVAFKYYYLNRTSFSGKLISAAWGYRPKRSLPPERWEERLMPCGQKLEDVKISCGDFEIPISAPSKESSVLMFVDPPYFSPAKNKHYRTGFCTDDHHRLKSALQKSPHHFFLTYDDCAEVRKLYSWANIYPVEFFYRVDNANAQNGRRKAGLELIISNYELKNKIYGRGTQNKLF